MKLFLCKLFTSFISLYSPRYPLAIVEKIYKKNNEISYKIMAVGEQRPIETSAYEILSEKKIKEKLPPDDLISVIEDTISEKTANKVFHLKEINRDGRLIIGSKNQKINISEEDFCKNSFLIENTYQYDLFQIVSNYYFNLGRKCEEINRLNQSKGHSTESSNRILRIVK